ncbi:hypothetical protein B0A48_11049 [Cryoendolithus antarcticus]|uniref:Uncharacterized protein n=1 Tax=Cryoendolithus antarcticus TaxID=1507870 RepID=A0A1V8SUA6_9PEZI|nr:hypothetical protein B0A48_11049 [Cryoendolithus antarcticus]
MEQLPNNELPQSPLLRLSTELRLQIYDHLFASSLGCLTFPKQKHHLYPLPPVFQVCSSIRLEALEPWTIHLIKSRDEVRQRRYAEFPALDFRQRPRENEGPWNYRRYWAGERNAYLSIVEKQLTTLIQYGCTLGQDGLVCSTIFGDDDEPRPWPE